MNLSAAAARFRARERTARDELVRGCDEDLDALDRLIVGPLRDARAALHGEILSMGTLETTFRRALLREHAEAIAMGCARSVYDNAGVRLRARFANYAGELAAAERGLLDEAQALAGRSLNVKTPRRVKLGRLFFDDAHWLVPACEELSVPMLGEWTAMLRDAIRRAVFDDAIKARAAFLNRADGGYARLRIALRLAIPGMHL